MDSLHHLVASRFAGRTVTAEDVAAVFGVNQTVARAAINDLKAMKLAKSNSPRSKPESWQISPDQCVRSVLSQQHRRTA